MISAQEPRTFYNLKPFNYVRECTRNLRSRIVQQETGAHSKLPSYEPKESRDGSYNIQQIQVICRLLTEAFNAITPRILARLLETVCGGTKCQSLFEIKDDKERSVSLQCSDGENSTSFLGANRNKG